MHIILIQVAKNISARIARLSWETILILAVGHFAISWGAIILTGGEEIAGGAIFWYFYITSATTVGYGDYSPATWVGRLITVAWIMPGGIALFTTIIAKAVQQISDRWRKSVRGQTSYAKLVDHIVILGWHGHRTKRMVDQLRGDIGEKNREIVLCSAQDIENPMPDQVRFVRGAELNTPDVLKRAGVAKAWYIIALGHDDSETLAAALGAAAINPDAHIVAYFDHESFADLLKAHCPHAECNVSLSIELMVRSAQDPGSSRVQRQLLSTLEGPTQFSLKVPKDTDAVSYGALFAKLKESHDATLIGVAGSALGDDLILNAPSGHRVDAGMIVYFLAARRIEPNEIDWPALNTGSAT
jgi:voltage-gated potassium channel